MLDIPCCHGPKLGPAFPVGDVFIVDKVGNRLVASIIAGQFVDGVNRGLIHLNEEMRGLLCCVGSLLFHKQATANHFHAKNLNCPIFAFPLGDSLGESFVNYPILDFLKAPKHDIGIVLLGVLSSSSLLSGSFEFPGTRGRDPHGGN